MVSDYHAEPKAIKFFLSGAHAWKSSSAGPHGFAKFEGSGFSRAAGRARLPTFQPTFEPATCEAAKVLRLFEGFGVIGGAGVGLGKPELQTLGSVARVEHARARQGHDWAWPRRVFAWQVLATLQDETISSKLQHSDNACSRTQGVAMYRVRLQSSA